MALAAGATDASGQTVVLEDFEETEIRVIAPDAPVNEPSSRLLFNQYEGDFTEGPDPGTEATSTDVAHNGSRSLKINVTGGNLYVSFWPNSGYSVSNYKFLRELLDPAESRSWSLNTYNRMRLWIKMPSQAGSGSSTPGNFNLQWGTYYRSPTGDPTSAESGGNHFYHQFNIPFTGEWHQVIMDTHPSHIRGGGGNTEWGDQEYPIGGLTTHNYFDLMTRWYLDIQGGLSGVPADFYVDDIELYREPNPENVAQVYNMNAVYVPSSNTVRVGWSRNKNENTVVHEVRYAFQSIHPLGFSNATFGANITPPNEGGYNGMSWTTTGINVSGQSILYVAIKPANSSSFRQIAIPLGANAADTTKPPAPGSLRTCPSPGSCE